MVQLHEEIQPVKSIYGSPAARLATDLATRTITSNLEPARPPIEDSAACQAAAVNTSISQPLPDQTLWVRYHAGVDE
jgi:hypothetical protein